MPETLFTIWGNVFRACLYDEVDHSIHGGTSGIGTMAIHLANLFGLTIIVRGFRRSAGRASGSTPITAINYKAEDFVAGRWDHGRQGCRHRCSTRSAAAMLPRLQCLAEEGAMSPSPCRAACRRRSRLRGPHAQAALTLTGSAFAAAPPRVQGASYDELHHAVWPLVAEGQS